MKTALTLDEAIAEGYHCCNTEESEGYVTRLSDIKSGKSSLLLETTYYLCEKEPRFHSVNKRTIEEIVQDHIDCQEEFYVEDGFDTAFEGCDDLLSELEHRINQNLRKHKFYFNSDIVLIPNP